jgi:hypothetical protein
MCVFLCGLPEPGDVVRQGAAVFGQGFSGLHGQGHVRGVGQAAEDRAAFFRAGGFDARGLPGIEVRLVDEHAHGQAEVVAQLGHAQQVVGPRWGRLGDEHGQGRAGERADDRAGDARRAVAQDELAAFLFGERLGVAL